MNEMISFFNTSVERSASIKAAVNLLSESGIEERGAVFTKEAVVNFMLDLIDYRTDKDLSKLKILEPSFGEGDFLLPIITRLIQSYKAHHGKLLTYETLTDCLRGVELHKDTYNATFQKVVSTLIEQGVSEKSALTLCKSWLIQDDFLLTEFSSTFTHVVGNPPYVRQELIPDALIKAYRQRFGTIYDRSDLYVPFFEHGLSLLKKGGKLTFICSDRWMKNRYGGPLRKFIAENYHVEHYIDMFEADAFRREVSAYPAIFTISYGEGETTRVARQPKIDKEYLSTLTQALTSLDKLPQNEVTTVPKAIKGKEPWLLDAAEQLALVRALEERFPPLEAAGCKVGIGVATGSDRVYIAPYAELTVEDERKLPLVMAPDVRSGTLHWSGKGVVNPFDERGALVNLACYPKLAHFFAEHEETIRKRNVARKNTKAWYRTIDRIYKPLTYQPKLLIPDIMDSPTIVYDDGKFYPHHNLYWITSDAWNLRALQTVLRSSLTKFFISTYSVKMRGGYLRYQAQNLRRVCLPLYETLNQATKSQLVSLAESENLDLVNAAAFKLYKLSDCQKRLVNKFT